MIEIDGLVPSTTQSLLDSQHRRDNVGVSGLHNSFRDPIDHVSRPWTLKTTDSFDWCRSASFGHNNDDFNSPGLIYIKIDKAASSTLAGINVRLAHKVGAKVLPQKDPNQELSEVCSHTYTHGRASDVLALSYSTATTTLSLTSRRPSTLLWTFVRDPARRAVSEYYHFWVSRRGYGVKNGLVKPFLESRKNFQLLYLLDQKHPEQVLAKAIAATNTTSSNIAIQPNDTTTSSAMIIDPPILPLPIEQLIQDHIINVYDFIGVVERMEESLAVMKLLWGVSTEDLIVMSAKQSGGWDDGRYNDTCYKIHPSPSSSSSYGSDDRHASDGKTNYSLSSYLQHYIQTDYKVDNFDYHLYEAVNASLDKTIALLGRINVERVRHEVRKLQSLVELKCQNHTIFPCSKNGTRQHAISRKNCYWFDSGCGFPCVDQVLNERNSSFEYNGVFK
jgi:hypothetical protein